MVALRSVKLLMGEITHVSKISLKSFSVSMLSELNCSGPCLGCDAPECPCGGELEDAARLCREDSGGGGTRFNSGGVALFSPEVGPESEGNSGAVVSVCGAIVVEFALCPCSFIFLNTSCSTFCLF